MLNGNPNASKKGVERFLIVRKLSASGLFKRSFDAVPDFQNSLITGVGGAFDKLPETRTGFLEHLEIMRLSV